MASNVIGHIVGNYRLVEKIGDGGMGTVYLAEHVLTYRPVAVKVLHPYHLDDEEYVARFFNEAKAAMQMQHPAIVRMFDCGTHEDGSAYLVMEYLEGEDLSKRLKRGRRLPVATAMLIGRQVAQALEVAHHRGVVHRDLKPDNLFMVPDAEVLGGERVKILDFGIAKLVHDTQSLHKTRTGSVLGTPTYMSPEQCKGTGNVDHRADLYSLGCILFRMMCGRIVFRSKGYGELIAMHIHMPPPRPTSLESSIPPLFEDIILTLLAKNPAERYQSATELLEVMDEAVANTHLGLPPPQTWAPVDTAPDTAPDTDPRVSVKRRAATDDETKLYMQRAPSRTPGAASSRGAVHEIAEEAVRELGHDYDALIAKPGLAEAGLEEAELEEPEIEEVHELDPETPEMLDESEHAQASTTLRSATGDMVDSAGQGDQPGRMSLWLWLGVIAALVLAAAAFAAAYFDVGSRLERYLSGGEPAAESGGTSRPGDEAAGERAAPLRVTLTLESAPPGAAVIRRSDGVRLGITPYTTTVLASDQALVVTLALDGHEDEVVTMPADRSTTKRVTLLPRP
jgi:eukaryotic-like serine/threonine-protein kinase